MKFEGTQVNIPIKGIMRAGTDNLCADGAMNEVIGMEYKDGSWLPYKEKERSADVLNDTDNTSVTNIKKVAIHITTYDSSHYVFLCSDGTLMYEVRRVSQPNLIVYVSELAQNITEISFMGNMLCAAYNGGIKYFLWKDGVYSFVKYSFPNVSLRASAGYLSNGEKSQGIFYFQQSQDGSDFSLDNIRDHIVAADGAIAESGGINGYHLAQIGFRLKNGEIVCNKPMQLIMNPQHYRDVDFEDLSARVNVNNYQTGFYETNANPHGVYPRRAFHGLFSSWNQKYVAIGPNGQGGTPYAFVPLTHGAFEDIYYYVTYRNEEGVHQIKRVAEDGQPVKMIIHFENFPGNQDTLKMMLFTKDSPDYSYKYNIVNDFAEVPTFAVTKYHHAATNSLPLFDQIYCIIAGNGIQFKVGAIPADTEVESICVFLSQSISPYKLYRKNGEINKDMLGYEASARKDSVPPGNYLDPHYYTKYAIKRRPEDEVIADLVKLKELYLVHEIPLSEIETTNEWIDIDLEGKLGAALTTFETLPLTALHYQDMLPTPQGMDVYNYRLHIYDLEQKIFNGYPYNEYAVKDGILQYEREYAKHAGYFMFYKCEVDVFLKDSHDAIRVAVFYDTSEEHLKSVLLEPFIFFPNKDATKMRFRIFSTNFIGTINDWYEIEIPLKRWENFDGAYYFEPSLAPIEVIKQVDEQQQPLPRPVVPTPGESLEIRHNVMKVSDIDYPSYFPTEYTYRIGNGTIMKIARFTTPISQDNFGSSPLIVFCSDGIYAMRTDTSGNGVYTSVDFVSPDVCLNKHSICEIGGGVLFAGDKGLMIVVGNTNGTCSVEEFCHAVNGVPRFLPATTQSKEARGVYKKMIDNWQILSKENNPFGDSISQTDFVDFLKNTNTHLVYISNKNKLLAFNDTDEAAYLIDIPTRNATKVSIKALGSDGQLLDKTLWEKKTSNYYLHSFDYLSEESGDIPCLVLSRPIKIQQDDKCSYRVVLTGYFEGILNNWADLVVLGSLDADNWRVIGVKEKKLDGGFHNLGCLTERGSWKYLMFIFAGKLSNNSHIDSIDITVDGRYNNKKR